VTDENNVKPIGVRFKQPPGEATVMLEVVDKYSECNHRRFWTGSDFQSVTYHLREGETEVECGFCHTRLDPMFVLKIMATEETQWSRNRERYIEEMKRLSERSRTKCFHCGHMTEISRR